mmetsp:Transcript_68766/g.212641  ORF Transcript_68766/g.212641 Transcript_68766/m.212641 type:complete len:722 (-) Transcript_68766:89-2254(-)
MADGMPGGPEDIAAENARLRKELQEMQSRREEELSEFEQRVESEKNTSQTSTELLQQRSAELESMKNRMVRLTRQLDDEVTRRDQIQAESSALERKVHDLSKGTGGPPVSASAASGKRLKDRMAEEDEQALRERGTQVSTKLMRVVDQWMRAKDLQQALLRNASINDSAFSTLVQALCDCPSLQILDLSQNLLTMDSCSDICLLITTAPSLSFISLAENLFSLRSIGYFMTAVMERQNTKRLMPLDLLDLQGNEGLVAAASSPCPESLLKQVQSFVGTNKLPNKGSEVVAQVMRSLWRFLHDTQHPQIKDTSPDEVAFHTMDKATIRKMENALMKILLLSNDGEGGSNGGTLRPVTANLAFSSLLEAPPTASDMPGMGLESRTVSREAPGASGLGGTGHRGGQAQDDLNRSLGGTAKGGLPRSESAGALNATGGLAGSRKPGGQEPRKQIADPFADLKTAFEPPREKLKTFNLKQIVTRNGTVLMNMLERLLEVTEIDAHDVETDQTLLEFACNTGNMGLAKLCYRRGANLAVRTRKGDTAFNIVTRNKRYDMMEFLHTYGVKVNSCDAEGMTALHVAAAGDDVDAVCRLLEWGADVNARDNKKRTPIHIAARGGNTKTTMLLLEVGADMNAKDEREYTAVAHAEAKNHFALMDRLVQLGGRGHGLQTKSKELDRTRSAKQIGELVVSAGMLKSSSLGRIGKVAVKGMPGPLSPAATIAGR